MIFFKIYYIRFKSNYFNCFKEFKIYNKKKFINNLLNIIILIIKKNSNRGYSIFFIKNIILFIFLLPPITFNKTIKANI